MALSDYRLCDVCEDKAFYDSNLTYEDGTDEWAAARAPYRIAGAEQYDEPKLLAKYGTRLGYVGDWAVICHECAKTHRVCIVPIESAA